VTHTFASLRRAAKSDDSTTWTTFEQAAEAADILGGNDYEGIGFELGGTDIAGIDFDNAINAKGDVDPYALSILALLGNPYTEKSPSGNGFHAFVECDALPEGKRKMSKGHEGVEIYHGREGGRYFTVTGDKVLGDGIPLIKDIELPYLLLTLNNNKKFKALWLGDTSAHGNDDSNADFALMCELAKLTQNDPVKMEIFFSASELGQREKWKGRKDYRDRTIKAAHDNQPKESTNIQASSRELAFHLSAVEWNPSEPHYVISAGDKQTAGWIMLGGAPSIICGPSGSSKTTLMYQMLIKQRLGALFFGHETYQRSFITMGVDRGVADFLETMKRMHLNPEMIKFKPLSTTVYDLDAVQSILNEIEATVPLPEIVFVEGVDMLVTKNDMKGSTFFMHEIHKIAERYKIAFILSMGSPKTKEGQGYTAARDNGYGSTGWGRSAGTFCSMMFPKNDDTSGRRKLTVVPRNGKPEKFALFFTAEGQLEIDPDNHEEDSNEAEQEFKEIDWYKTQARLSKTDPAKKWWTVVDLERALHLAHSTVERHVKSDKQKGRLKQKSGNKSGRGSAAEYRWNESKTNPLWVEQRAQETAEQLEVF
jgi:hypothetical protein